MPRQVRWVDKSEALRLEPQAAGLPSAAAEEQRPVPSPRSTPRDELIYLLHIAAEIEHSLMVQYLYAAYSLKPRDEEDDQTRKDQLGSWRSTLLQIAREEMGHLATVLNLLRAIGGPLSLEREDYPFRSDFYPFHFQLEPLSRHSLAKYVLAERPQGLAPEVLERLRTDAALDGEPTGDEFRRVGALFDQIRDLFKDPDVTLQPDSVRYQASRDAWSRGNTTDMEIHVAATTGDALVALQRVAEQGEGADAGDLMELEDSHFSRLFALYEAFPADDNWTPTRNVPRNPTTTVAGETEITNPLSAAWADLFDLRYRTALFDLAHSYIAPDATVPRARMLFEMKTLADLAGHLTTLDLLEAGGEERAGPTFQLPYTLAIPPLEADRLRARRDLASAATLQTRKLVELGVPELHPLLTAIRSHDREVTQQIDAVVPPPVRELREVRILPPIAIARLGSSPTPLDNYELVTDGTGFRKIVPTETLDVDEDGRVTARLPDSISFKDGDLVRPLAPFFEVWAQFQEDGHLLPLTHEHLSKLGATIEWRVRGGNHKIARRTGDPNDRIDADTGAFSDHGVQELTGACGNFKPTRSISLGSARFLSDSPGFPEIRLRITPAEGKVYGSDPNDDVVDDDPYNPDGTTWVGHRDGTPGRPPYTNPAGIYARNGNGSLGYLDDSCDGIVDVVITIPGRAEPLRASARFTAGPPDYAPDSLPVRSVSHELQQIVLGYDADEQSRNERLADVIDLVRRAAETVRLMNTNAMNEGGMASHDTGTGRRGEPIFRPTDRARYRAVLGFHNRVLRTLERYRDAPNDATRLAAHGALDQVDRRLRTHDQVGDLTDAGRALMPAMMRGSEGRHLVVTRRQLSQVRLLLADLAPLPAGNPRDAMINLVRALSVHASRHAFITTDDPGESLEDLFSNPPRLLDFLQNNDLQDGSEPLIVAGEPDASGFVRLISTGSGHPMSRVFTDEQRQVVRAWILELGN